MKYYSENVNVDNLMRSIVLVNIRTKNEEIGKFVLTLIQKNPNFR